MKCSQCQAKTQEGMSFCEDCGTRLAFSCPTCGSEVVEDNWVYLTPQVNATLLQIRQMATDQKLLQDAGSLTWGHNTSERVAHGPGTPNPSR
jgi:predicted amidophosphoribosyltransferase